MKKVFFYVIMTSFLLVSCATQQERAERREQMRKAVAEAVETNRMRLEISWMNTQRYGSKSVTPDFFLELRGDTLNSYLPYMGQVYKATLTTQSQGLNFEVPVQAMQKSHPKADRWLYVIDAKTDEDSYKYIIELFETGKADIRVTSANRDHISFDGGLVLPHQ